MANLYVFHTGIGEGSTGAFGGDFIHLWYSSFDGATWRKDTQIQNLDSFGSPSAVAWDGGISVFHQGWNSQPGPVGGGENAPDGQIWCTFSPDGTNWRKDTPIPHGGIYADTCSPVVYNGQLYVFRRAEAYLALWYQVFDGKTWHFGPTIQNVGMNQSTSVSAVAWAGGITVFHQGINDNIDPNGQLWYSYSPDGANWGGDTLVPVPNLQMSGSPSAVVYNGLLYVFFQGGNQYTGQLWYVTYDGTNWREYAIHNLGMSDSPSAVLWKGGITVFHQGSGLNGQLWYTYSPDGINWGGDTPVQNVGMQGSPSAVVL